MHRIKVLLADDHAVLRAGLKMLLESQPDMIIVGEAGDGVNALRLVSTLRPDVLLLDISMPDMDGLEVLKAARREIPACRILLLTMHEEEAILRKGLQAGASGYVLKKAAESELITAIRAVSRGEAFVDPSLTRRMIDGYLGQDKTSSHQQNQVTQENLTEREIEILQLVAEGFTNKDIAEKLVISVKTVETHKAHIAEKLGGKSRVEWMRYVRQKGWLKT